MKKLITLIGVLTLAWSVEAQNFLSQSFLNAKAIAFGTNTAAGATNLNSYWLFAGTSEALKLANPITNRINMEWTNRANVNITNTQANATNYNTDTFNLFSDVSLWTKRDGTTWAFDKLMNTFSEPVLLGTSTNPIPQETLYTFSSPAKLVIKTGGTVAYNAPTLNFVFVPLADGVNEPYGRNEDWTVGVTLGAGPTNNVVITNVPMYLWNGCAKLRLRSVTPAAAVFNGATTSNIWLYSVSLNGFVP